MSETPTNQETRQQLLHGIFTAGVVLERTRNVFAVELGELLHVMRERCGFSARARFTPAADSDAGVSQFVQRFDCSFAHREARCRATVDLVYGGTGRFVRHVKAPYCVWQLQSVDAESSLESACSFGLLPCSDSEDPDNTPGAWRRHAKSLANGDTVVFYYRGSNKYAIFYTPFLCQKNDGTVAGDPAMGSVLARYVDKICSGRFVVDPEDFSGLALALRWSEEHKGYVVTEELEEGH